MVQLSYKEIETLQHILNTHISNLDTKYDDLLLLQSKLVTMRAELEYPKEKYMGYRFHDDENRNIY